jgi:heterodisulfide reductase subunit B
MARDLEYALFLGCIIPNRYPFIEYATKKTFERLRIKLHDLEGASCCPAPGVFRSFDRDAWLTLGARNITIAEEKKLDIAVMCNGCYGSLLEVNHSLKFDDEKRESVNKHLEGIGKKFEGTTKIKHIVDILYNDFGLENLKIRTKYARKNRLDLDVAVHYGCHLTKPSELRPFKDNIEDPKFLDELVEITGCKSIDYRTKNMCCGAGGAVRSGFKEVSLDFTREKLEDIKASGADAIVTACPFCFLQFDLGQREINTLHKDKNDSPFNIPVIYITQLLGLALGMDAESVGLQMNEKLSGVPPFISINPLLKKIGEKVG